MNYRERRPSWFEQQWMRTAHQIGKSNTQRLWMESYRDDSVAFARDILGITLYPWQEEILRAIHHLPETPNMSRRFTARLVGTIHRISATSPVHSVGVEMDVEGAQLFIDGNAVTSAKDVIGYGARVDAAERRAKDLEAQRDELSALLDRIQTAKNEACRDRDDMARKWTAARDVNDYFCRQRDIAHRETAELRRQLHSERFTSCSVMNDDLYREMSVLVGNTNNKLIPATIAALARATEIGVEQGKATLMPSIKAFRMSAMLDNGQIHNAEIHCDLPIAPR